MYVSICEDKFVLSADIDDKLAKIIRSYNHAKRANFRQCLVSYIEWYVNNIDVNK